MSLTRKLLKGMGLTEEQVDTIIEAHSETVNALKEERDAFKADAEKLPAVKSELAELKAKGDDGWKEKHDALKKQFDDFKKNITDKETRQAKENAVRAYFEKNGISGKNLDIAIRGSEKEISAIELDGENIKDASALDNLVNGDFSGLVSTTTVKGAQTITPPTTNNATTLRSREEIMKIKDTSERQKAWGEYIIQQKGE